MPNYTPNLNLEKPLQTETYNIDVHNANSDKIDAASNDHRTALVLDHPNKSVTEAKLADEAVSTRALKSKSVTEAKLADEAVSTRALKSKSVTEAKLADEAVSTRALKSKSVTEAKLADSGVVPGAYTKVTVDRTGRVTTAENPTTLAGYGITDAYTKMTSDATFIKSVTYSGHTVTVTKGNGTISTFNTADNNTTYGLATTSANGLLRALSNNTSHFLRGDGKWGTPSDTDNISSASLGENGYIKFNNSLLIQWGVTESTQSSRLVNLPIPFTSKYIACANVAYGTDIPGCNVTVYISRQSLTAMNLYPDFYPANSPISIPILWIAVGY